MSDKNQKTSSAYILDDILRSNLEFAQSREKEMKLLKMNLLNAGAESSGLKKDLQKCQAEIAALKKEVQEILGRERKTKGVIKSARSLINSYIEFRSLNAEAKKLLQHILSVLELETERNNEDLTNLTEKSVHVEDSSAENKIERMRKTASKNNLDERRDSNFSGVASFPTTSGMKTTTVFKVRQVQPQQQPEANFHFPKTVVVEPDAISQVQQDCNVSATCDSTVLRGGKRPQNPPSITNSPIMGARSNPKIKRDNDTCSVSETMDFITAESSSVTESVAILPWQRTESNTMPQKATTTLSQKELGLTLNITKTPLRQNTLEKSVDFAQPMSSTQSSVKEKGESRFQEDVLNCTTISKNAAALEFFTKLLNTDLSSKNANDALKKVSEKLKMLEYDQFPLDQMVHVDTIWKYAVKNTDLIRKHPTLATWIWNKYKNCGKYKEAYDFSCEAARVLERTFGANNRWALAMKSRKGRMLQNLGHYSDSLDLLITVYQEQNFLFGEEYDDCLRTANLIGVAQWKLNNDDDAMKWYQSTLEKRRRINGKNHPETRALKKNIAFVLSEQGKYKEATEILKKVLQADDIMNGPEHRKTLNTKFNLACERFNQGKEVLRMFKEVLEVQERVLELDHPDTLSTKEWLAVTYKSIDKYEESLTLAEEVYEKRVVIFGPNHPDTISSKTFLEMSKCLKTE